jgi:hypothetical protein
MVYKNKEKEKKWHFNYYRKNRKIKLNYNKNYYQENRDKIKVQSKVYREELKEKYLIYLKDYRKTHKKEKNNWEKEYNRSKRITDIQFKILCRLRAMLYNSLKRYLITGKIMSSNQYGINYENIIEHLKPFPKDVKKYHIDHIKPLCSFDLSDPDQIKIAFAPENHQWLLAEENLIKGNRY